MNTTRRRLSALLRLKFGDSAQDEAYAALIVRSTGPCCEAALETLDRPILKRDRPQLPLPACSMPARCVCRLRARPDRRIGERRFSAAVQPQADLAPHPRKDRDRRKL